MILPDLTRLRQHLNFTDPSFTENDSEILDALAVAVEVIRTDPEFPLVAAALEDEQDHPALRWALMEFVRDLWTGSLSGPNGLPVDVDVAEEPEFRGGLTLGRPTIPVYVRGLLAPYRASVSSGAPRGVFPPPPVYPAW